MKEIPDLSGAWHSRYKYGSDRHSERIVDLRQYGLVVNGASRLDDSGSELFLELWLRREKLLEGFWKERTSPKGKYEGKEFQGVLHLILNELATEARGQWSGHNRGDTEVNSGEWVLRRQE